MPRVTDQRLLVWAIVLSQFGPPFMFAGVAVALPTMGADLEAGATSLGLVETLFLAGGLAFLLPIGWLADATDKRALYKLGLLSFGVTSIAIGVMSWLPGILVIRFLQGVTSATFAATGPAILSDLVPPERRGRVFGASIGAIYAGLTVGPVVAGFLIDTWGWRAVFFAGAATIFGGYGFVHRRLSSSWRRPANRVHLPSVALVILAVLSLVGGTAILREGALGYALLGIGFVLSTAFVVWQRHLERPLLDVRALMRNSALRSALLIQLLLYMSAFSTIFMLSIYMQVSLGHPARTSGQVLATGSVLMALTAPVAGVLVDRYRPALVSNIGVVAVLASAALAVTLTSDSSLWLVAIILSVQGVGFALFASPNMTVIMNSVPDSASGTAAALGAKSRSLGMVAGMLITTLLISLDIGNDPIAEHPLVFVGTLRLAFWILGALTTLALLLCWWRREVSDSHPA